MPRSGVRIKLLGLGFLIKAGFVFARTQAPSATRPTYRATEVDIDEQHHQEQDAKSNAQIKHKTFAHITSGADRLDICEKKGEKMMMHACMPSSLVGAVSSVVTYRLFLRARGRKLNTRP